MLEQKTINKLKGFIPDNILNEIPVRSFVGKNFVSYFFGRFLAWRFGGRHADSVEIIYILIIVIR